MDQSLRRVANANDFITAMAVDSSGNVFVTGSGSDDDYVTIKYSSSLTPPRLSIARDGSGGWLIRHTGVPDLIYRLQRAVSLAGPWSDVATNTAPAPASSNITKPPHRRAELFTEPSSRNSKRLPTMKYLKTRGVIGRRKTPWTGDTGQTSHK